MIKKIVEFGDFQTPYEFALEVCTFIKNKGIRPSVILEPTCGKGNFIEASAKTFNDADEILGFEINKEYLESVKYKLSEAYRKKIKLLQSDFFTFDWKALFKTLGPNHLVLGNLPWVTSSQLGTIGSNNLPYKSNFQCDKGIDAITGKANFDISEWMLIHLLEWMQDQKSYLAMLCKTTVARKVLKHAWNNDFKLTKAEMFRIDSKKHFDVAVDACLLLCSIGEATTNRTCKVYDGFSDKKITTFGIHGSELIVDIETYNQLADLDSEGHVFRKWRSGLKHDCSKVMVLRKENSFFKNGLGETINIENKYLYPYIKGTEIARGYKGKPDKWVIVTQKHVGQETTVINKNAPMTWNYLNRHAKYLDKRKSSIYKQKPPFSIFGIGDYSFTDWKVAISGLHKKIHFEIIPPHKNKTCMIDDTCYLLPCGSYEEASLIAELLNSETAKKFLSCFIFWDSKRPINNNVLKRIDIVELAKNQGQYKKLKKLIKTNSLF